MGGGPSAGRGIGRSRRCGDGSGRIGIDGMGGMWNGGDGIGRRGMDIFGIGRTIGSGGPQGFGGVSVLVVFFCCVVGAMGFAIWRAM